jgi:ATP-dependent RNA helicase DDX55/SPB4
MNTIREIILTDRDLSDRGAKALVSSVRAYTKHEANFIFRPADLDYSALSTAFGLLRIPAMPEVKDWRKRIERAAKKKAEAAERAKENPEAAAAAEQDAPGAKLEEDPEQLAWTDAELDWDTFTYASKARETARLAALAEKRAKASDPAVAEERAAERKKRKIRAEMREAWSVQKDRKTRKEDRRDKKDNKRKAEWERKRAEEDGTDVGPMPEVRKKKAKAVQSEDEDMEADYRSLKREVHEEKKTKKGNQDTKVAVGMFDGLD